MYGTLVELVDGLKVARLSPAATRRLKLLCNKAFKNKTALEYQKPLFDGFTAVPVKLYFN
jgi:hypothetical protein